MAIGHAGNHRSKSYAGGSGGQSGQKCPGLEARPVGIPIQSLEVIEQPDAVEAGIFGEPDALEKLCPGLLMLSRVDAELRSACGHGRPATRPDARRAADSCRPVR